MEAGGVTTIKILQKHSFIYLYAYISAISMSITSGLLRTLAAAAIVGGAYVAHPERAYTRECREFDTKHAMMLLQFNEGRGTLTADAKTGRYIGEIHRNGAPSDSLWVPAHFDYGLKLGPNDCVKIDPSYASYNDDDEDEGKPPKKDGKKKKRDFAIEAYVMVNSLNGLSDFNPFIIGRDYSVGITRDGRLYFISGDKIISSDTSVPAGDFNYVAVAVKQKKKDHDHDDDGDDDGEDPDDDNDDGNAKVKFWIGREKAGKGKLNGHIEEDGIPIKTIAGMPGYMLVDAVKLSDKAHADRCEISHDATPVVPVTWGGLKSIYR